jgi:hypothetical protein
MASATARYKEAKDAANKAKAEVKKVAKEALKEMTQVFFSENPAILSIGWDQYTPYFNDGDPCVFSANIEYPAFTFKAKDGKTLAYNAGGCELTEPGTAVRDEDVEYSEDNDLDQTPYEKEISRHEKAVVKFLKTFDDDDFEQMFGDHVQISVNNKGKITVEEYEHD